MKAETYGPGTRDLSSDGFAALWWAEHMASLEKIDDPELAHILPGWLSDHVALRGQVLPWHKGHRGAPWPLDGYTTRDILELGAAGRERLGITEDACCVCGANVGLFWMAECELGEIACGACRNEWVGDLQLSDCEIPLELGSSKQIKSRVSHDGNCVYFVEAAGLVKIGKARMLVPRLAGIATGSPVPQKLIATAGPAELESAYHGLMKDRRERLEWFRLSRAEVFALPGVAPVSPVYADEDEVSP
jgi:hypothetical protein